MTHRKPGDNDERSSSSLILEQPEDYLSPEQRADAIAGVLASIALDLLRTRHEEHIARL